MRPLKQGELQVSCKVGSLPCPGRAQFSLLPWSGGQPPATAWGFRSAFVQPVLLSIQLPLDWLIWEAGALCAACQQAWVRGPGKGCPLESQEQSGAEGVVGLNQPGAWPSREGSLRLP